MDENKIILELTSEQDCLRGWGTNLDNKNHKDTPLDYLHADFEEMDHEDLIAFLKLPDVKKIEFAYWAQVKSSRRAFKSGFFIGVAISILILVLVISF